MSRRMTTLKLSHEQLENRQMTHLLRVFPSYDNLVIKPDLYSMRAYVLAAGANVYACVCPCVAIA